MEMTNIQSIRRTAENLAKVRTSETASPIALRNYSQEVWFPALFYFLSEQRTSNRAGVYSFGLKKADEHVQRESAWLSTCPPGEGALSWKEF